MTGLVPRVRARALIGASWLACRPARGTAGPAGRVRRRPVVPGHAGPRRPGPAQPPARRDLAGRRPARAARSVVGPPTTRAPWSAWSACAYRHAARYYLEVARTPAMRADELDAAARHRDAGHRGRGLRRRPGRVHRSALRGDRAAGAVPGRPGRRRGGADGDDRRPRPAGLVRAHPRRGRRPDRRPARGASRALLAALRDGTQRGPRRRPRPDRRRHARDPLRGAGDAAPRARRCSPSRAACRRTWSASAGEPRALPRPAGAGRGPGRGQPARARDRDDGRHRPRLRAHRQGRPGAVVGGLLPDLAGPRGGGRRHDRPRSPRRRPGRPAHPHRRLGRHGRRGRRSSHHVAARGDLDVIAITDHERIDAALAARAMAVDRGLAVRGRRRRGGHDAGRASAGPVPRTPDPSVPLAPDDDPRHPRRGRAGHPGPSAGAVPAVRPGLGPAPPARRPGSGGRTRTRIETFNPTALGRPWHDRVVRFADRHGLPGVGNSDAHALGRHRDRLDDVRGPDRGGPAPGDRDRDDRPGGSFHGATGQVGVFGQQLRKRAATRATRSRGRVRRGTGRTRLPGDHGPPSAARARAGHDYEPPGRP